ncbi:hypothetical protein CEW92_02260 [Bacillaceae bacterium SAS-127]|nr:hypothetical protein CEW92_02260 [Bacillaceae bacterium SAS-127]
MGQQVHTKDKLVLLKDPLLLTSQQLVYLEGKAVQKTQQEWQDSNTGIKVTLTKEQKEHILNIKNQILKPQGQPLTPAEIIEKDIIKFSKHGHERLIERYTEQPPQFLTLHEAVTEILQLLIDSNHVKDTCEWKGYEYLSYNFTTFNSINEFVEVVVNITGGHLMIVITIFKSERANELVNRLIKQYSRSI